MYFWDGSHSRPPLISHVLVYLDMSLSWQYNFSLRHFFFDRLNPKKSL